MQAYREGDRMILLTRDNGQGISKDIQGALGNQAVDSAEGTGTALYNIRQRMAEIYGKQASFRIDSEPGHGTTVMIAVPIQFHEWREASC